jgi:LmbE family N-acetylglucosaminyl deacetylase
MEPVVFEPLTPKVVLGIAAHPDDLDFGAGGTLATFAKQGAAVHYLQLTDGCKGSSDPKADCKKIAKMRQQEQLDACDIIGGKSVEFLRYTDGELAVTMELKEAIVRVIRKLKPDVVITTDPTMVYATTYGVVNHPDHRAAGQATLDAVYPLARDHLAFPKLLKQGYEPHKVKTILLTNFEHKNYYVNITDALQTKLQAAAAHASQVDDIAALQHAFTRMAERDGATAGHTYAEGFVRIDVRPQ